MADIQYTVTEHIGVLSTNSRCTLELNMVSWNGKPEKYDLRRWQSDSNAKIMYKGMTFNEEEAQALYSLLKARFEAVK